jgi:hypothetical protein
MIKSWEKVNSSVKGENEKRRVGNEGQEKKKGSSHSGSPRFSSPGLIRHCNACSSAVIQNPTKKEMGDCKDSARSL